MFPLESFVSSCLSGNLLANFGITDFIYVFCVFVILSKKDQKWKEKKKQKTIKKKANLMGRANHLMEMTDRINDLKTKYTV